LTLTRPTRTIAAAAAAWMLLVAERVAGALHPEIVERVYARGAFPLVLRALTAVTGWIPFSLAEALVFVLLLLALFALVRVMVRWRARPPRPPLSVRVARVAAALAAVVLGFDLLWGLNYDREPVARLLAFDTRPAPAAELAALAGALLAEAAELRRGQPEDARGVFLLADGRRGAMGRAGLGFTTAGLGGLPAPEASGGAKAVLLSPLMSYAGLGGIFIPFTAEPNVNATLPDWEIPFTAAHEVAHQRGYAREDEANYVGYRACRAHPGRDFRYSGTFRAALYALSALAGPDRAAYARLRSTLPPPLIRDLTALSAWRRRYESRLGEVQDRINDVYLKTQGQAEGVQSYGRMVDLLLAERRRAPPGPESAGRAR